jgi:hypothetical protein
MSKKNEITCLTRLNDITGALSDLLSFLLSEKLIDREIIKEIMSSADQVRSAHSYLTQLNQVGKFQLLEYEWQVLPVERIKITIVTDRSSKILDHNF